jgi:hypothetical protein
MNSSSASKNRIVRFIKDTINGCHWELNLTYYPDGKIELWSGHLRKEDYHLTKESLKVVTPAQAESFYNKNARYIIEDYYE